jgi:hypothetical protein
MQHKILAASLALLSLAPAGLADTTSQESTQITGGTLVQPMQQMARFSKATRDMLAPTITKTVVHGNQKATLSKDYVEIYDLDKETITRVDNVHKTYTVITFAEMRKQFAKMPQQMQKLQQQMNQATAPQPQSDLKISYDVQVKNTGATRNISGVTAQEQLVTLTVKVTDPNAAASGTAASAASPADGVTSISYVLTTDAWIAPDPPELAEIRDFDIRFGKKLMQGMDMSAWARTFQRPAGGANPGLAAMLGNQPGAQQALAQMAEEMAKIKGTRVLEVTSLGGTAAGPGVTQSAAAPAAAPPSGGSVASQVASDTATQTAAGESGRMGVFGSALTNSALSAFHRKKAQPAPAAAAPAASAGTQGSASAVMMEMTRQKTFSQEPVPASDFEVPAGYAKTASAMQQMAD